MQSTALLLDFFQEINTAHFDGFLDAPVLRWNTRLRSSAGRFIRGSRRFWKVQPPVVEIASYLLTEPNAEVLIRDTLAHEMIHYWLWVRRRPCGHNPEFYAKMRLMGVSRYNPVPRQRPYRYIYRCPFCLKAFPARRKLKPLACAACCNEFGDGKYQPSFALYLDEQLPRSKTGGGKEIKLPVE